MNSKAGHKYSSKIEKSPLRLLSVPSEALQGVMRSLTHLCTGGCLQCRPTHWEMCCWGTDPGMLCPQTERQHYRKRSGGGRRLSPRQPVMTDGAGGGRQAQNVVKKFWMATSHEQQLESRLRTWPVDPGYSRELNSWVQWNLVVESSGDGRVECTTLGCQCACACLYRPDWFTPA